MNIEDRIKQLEAEIFEIKSIVNQLKEYSQGVQGNLWDSSDKQKETDRGINNRISDTQHELYDQAESINVTSDTLDTVMEVVIPTQAEAIDEVIDTVDTLMTTIIPELMGME